jgi:LIVCS family branched-chain amino acid:cation transporter
MSLNKPSYIVVGSALFSMFFGSGNLIFPLMLGRDAGSAYVVSTLGFILSAVMIPCLGVIAIAFAEGNYQKIFSSLFSSRLSTLLIFIILLSFVPFGAAPRCVILAHASLNSFIPMPDLWLFSMIFMVLVWYFIYDQRNLINNFGIILTPLLLISITIMVISAFLYGEVDPPTASHRDLFVNSLLEGYNTQDLFSALFFSSSLILLMKNSFDNKRELIVTMLKGSLVGILLLTILYMFLIASSSLHSDILIGHSGADLVSILAKHTLGQKWGLVAGFGVALACLTTAVALVMAFSEFLRAHILNKKYHKLALPISLLSIYLTSLLAFEGIMAVVAPLMKIIYPLVVIIVLRYLFKLWLKAKSQS